ncbi:RHS repeat-associated core domain-containing protein [Roseburia hominis]
MKQTTTFTYDKLHRLTGSVDAKGGASSYTYDIRDNLTSETNALGQTSTYTYDVAGRMTEMKDPLGQATTLLYDPVGNLTEATAPGGRKTSFGYDSNYNLTGVTDPMGYVTSYEYDKSNRLSGITDPFGQKESYQYDKDGRVTKETDKAGKSTAYAYDPHGNVKMITDKTGLNTHFTYDANDNLKSVTDAAGGKTTYGYDSMNWLTSYTSALGKVTKYTYDLEGNLTSRKDASGRVENMRYDEAGRLVSHISAGGKKTAYDYDELNSLVKKSYEDAKGKKTEADVLSGYDAMGQRISMKDAIGDAAYEYDALGRITKATDSAGQTVTYAYDESGNLQEIGYPDGSKVLYAYDLNDNLIKVTDRQGSVTEYRYDALNRMVQTLRPNELVTDVAYDAMDHITKLVTYCKGCDEVISTYEYTYNEQGFITGETTTESLAGYTYDDKHDRKHEDGKHDSKYPHGNKHNGKHDKDGEGKIRVVTTTRSYTYDENWQLTKCTEKEENKGTTTYEYQYDADGNRTRYIKTTAGKTVESVTYKYNDANQLISRTDDKAKKNRTTTYQYDKDGNLVSESSGKKNTITYEYTAENRLKAVSTSKEVLLAALYDGDGNKLFQMDYVEDSKETQKGSVLIPESAKTEKGNSPAEQLAALVPKKRQERNYTITQYVNDVNRENAEVLMELKVDGTTKAAYTYGEQRLGKDTAGGAFYYLYDGQGSVAGLTSSDGTMKNSYRYDPYGALTFGEPDGINYYGYNGESTNTNTGLQYLRARYYDPENGNFTSEDSWAGYLDLPLSRNRYAYTMNNPVNYTDPSGHRVPTPSAAGSSRTTTRQATNGGPTAGGMTKPAGSTKGGKVSAPKTNTASIVRNVVTKNQTTKRMYSRMSITGGPSTGGPQSNGRNNQSTYTSYQNYIAQSKARTQRLVKRELCTPDTERISDGNIKVARGLSVAAAGTSIVFAVVASGGTMLVPILIGATMAVIGAADATEGGLDIWYGRTNPSKESSNLVKEYAFNGNDDWYEATINALMATTLWSGTYVNGLNPDRSGPVSNLSDRAQVGTLEGNSEAASHKTLIRGDEWYRYFQDTYGAENVKWEANSFEEIVRHPTSLNGYTADEVADILGSGWTKSTYGSNGSGWKFIEDAHPDNMVFYHGGGGIHEGSYYGFSSGKYGTVKVVDTNTYVPLPGDKAYIIYSEDH